MTVVSEDDIVSISVYDITDADTKIGGTIMPESSERGSLTEAVYYILLSLYQPMHGYGIMQTVGEWSRGRVILGAGTLYGALNTLLEKNWIQTVAVVGDSRKKEYVITEIGRQQIEDELLRLDERLTNGRRVTGGDKG